jgi:hypothetical protein
MEVIRMHQSSGTSGLAVLLVSLLLTQSFEVSSADAAPKPAPDGLTAGFLEPPNSARPRVWWHWMNGNITREGIDKDLTWMQRIGIGGVQSFDIGLATRQVVDQRLTYMTQPWRDAFRFAAGRAQQLGLEMTIAASPGWSETGGPWVKPADAMKKLVWSETSVVGGKRFHASLPAPPSVTGPYQDFALSNAKQTYYADVSVVAFPEDEWGGTPTPRYASASGQTLDAAALMDGTQETRVSVASSAPGSAPIVLVSYDSPATIRSATMFVRNALTLFTPPIVLPRLEAREGAGWRKVADMPVSFVPTTISFAPVTSREFRLVLDAPPAVSASRPPGQVSLADLRLSPASRVDRFEIKAGFGVERSYDLTSAREADVRAVEPSRVLDLTDRMTADGVLDWTPPKGRWRVLRLGYSLIGVTNHPAAEEATGLEVDKYDAAAVQAYMAHYLEMYREAAGPELFGSQGVQAILTDSIEVGASNWTPKMLEQFQRLRGYDPRPWLPTLTGVIVGSRAQSDAFLYDFRRTLADLIASEHYGQVARSAHAAGLKVYGESLEGGRPSLGDDMTMRSHADIPMAALWTFAREDGPLPGALADMRGAASVAHVYGRNFVAAESMTSMLKPWAFAPADLRRIVDLEFANGINRPVIHTSVHQPVDKAPGISLSIFGQYFTRLETWAEMARPWIDYIARASFLLQQGRNVADVAYFSGEEAPLLGPHGDEPTQYAYDFVNSDMLRDALSVEGDQILSKGGARYRLLYLGGSSEHMTLQVLRRLAELVDAGATILGNAPIGSPSLGDDVDEYGRLVRRLWPGGALNTVGKGRVMTGFKIEAALAQLGVAPDFSYKKSAADSEVLFVHRKVDGGDLYFVNNRKDRTEKFDARFRVSGKIPEIWRADTGASEPVSYRTDAGETVVPLEMLPDESFFVLFRKPAVANSAVVSKPNIVPLDTLSGAWSVRFQEGRGAPATLQLATLASLSEHADPGVKYFSGVATYARTFALPRTAKPGAPLWLDLGRVGDVAEVSVNGTYIGTAWKPPFRLDIAKAVKSGRNTLEIRVANLWVNRLIGDAQPGAQKLTFTVYPTYSAKAPLRPSGLMGPVQLMTVTAGSNSP